jgi:hypothetical protein
MAEQWDSSHTVYRDGRQVGFVAHAVYRNGRAVGYIEFRSIVIRALEAIHRRGRCVSGGQPRVGDRNMSAGGQALGDDLNVCGGEQIVVHDAR